MDIDYQKKYISLQNVCKKQEQTITKLQAEIRERCQSYLLHASRHKKINGQQQSKILDKSQSPKREDNSQLAESIVRVYEETSKNEVADEMVRSNIIGDDTVLKNKNHNFAIHALVSVVQKGKQEPIKAKQEINLEQIHQSYKLRISKIQEERNKYVKDFQKLNSELGQAVKKNSELQRKLVIATKNENKNKSKIQQINILQQGLTSIYRKIGLKFQSMIHREVKIQFQQSSLKEKINQISNLVDLIVAIDEKNSNIFQAKEQVKTDLIQILNKKQKIQYVQQFGQTQQNSSQMGSQWEQETVPLLKNQLDQQSQCDKEAVIQQIIKFDQQSQCEIKLSQNQCNTEMKVMQESECQFEIEKMDDKKIQTEQILVQECQNCIRLHTQVNQLRQSQQISIQKQKEWNPQFIVLKQVVSKATIDISFQTQFQSNRFKIQQLVPLSIINSKTQITKNNVQQELNQIIQQKQLKFAEQKRNLQAIYAQSMQNLKKQFQIGRQQSKSALKHLQDTLQLTKGQLNQLQQQNLSLIAQSMQKQHQMANLRHLLQKSKKELDQSNLNLSKYMEQLEHYKQIQNTFEKTKQQLDRSRSIIDDLQSSKLSRDVKDLKDSQYQKNQSYQNQNAKKSSLKVGQSLQQPYYIQEQLQSDPSNEYVKRSFIRKKIVRRNLSATAYRIVSKSKEEVDAIVKNKVHEYADKSRQKKQKIELSNKKVSLQTLAKEQRISELSEENRESDFKGDEGKVVKIIEVTTTTPNEQIKTAKIYSNNEKDSITFRRRVNG